MYERVRSTKTIARSKGCATRASWRARRLSGSEHSRGPGRAMTAPSAILIVEDDADVVRAARVALADAFSHIESLPSPAGLEAALAMTTFDAVLLDMNFVAGERSGGAGLDALARIQAVDRALAVVLMTAYGGVSLAVDALKRGAADFVLKPWRNDKLTAAVIAAAEGTRARRSGATLDLDVIERAAIERALAQHGGNISLAAGALGISRGALYRRMSKYGL
uniref:CheY-like response regulator receiver domain protein n=1 Tax=uncultured bacterium BLR8 TaxID=506524 RepID=C0IN96_9BACT|nr:CheY-like response regulator receiver domain protein [uncultured bacterium BLR8]